MSKPVILRARVCRELSARHPRGMTAGQIGQYVTHTQVKAEDLRQVLDDLVSDGLLARGLESRPAPRDPLPIFRAAGPLVAKGGGRC